MKIIIILWKKRRICCSIRKGRRIFTPAAPTREMVDILPVWTMALRMLLRPKQEMVV